MSRRGLLGDRAGGCTESCAEMHTFSWPCEQSIVDLPPTSQAYVWKISPWLPALAAALTVGFVLGVALGG